MMVTTSYIPTPIRNHSLVTNPTHEKRPSLRTFSSTPKKPSLQLLLDREIENEGNDEFSDSPRYGIVLYICVLLETKMYTGWY